MRGCVTICRRELAGLFLSPLAWILLLVTLLLNGLFFQFYVSASNGDVVLALETALGGGAIFWAFMVVLTPLITMRMVSEEARDGTLEFLLTAPVSDAAVIVGKFLAATTFMAVLWISVPMYGWVVASLGVDPDWGHVWGGYIGAVLTSGLFVAIGLLASTSTQTPLLAAFLAFVANLVWLMLPLLAQLMMAEILPLVSGIAGSEVAVELINRSLEMMDVVRHLQHSFQRGMFDGAEIVFFLTWTSFFLFLSIRLLEAKRWRG
jgi:ABC-2 type transport system permease protein